MPASPSHGQHQAEHAAREADDQHLGQVLAHDVAPARAERAAQPRERARRSGTSRAAGPTTFTRQTARNSSAMPISTRLSRLHDVVEVQPLVDVEQPVVERARQAARRLLRARVVVEERLVAVAILRASAVPPTSAIHTHSEFRKSWDDSIGPRSSSSWCCRTTCISFTCAPA